VIYLFNCILLDTFMRDLKTLVFITFRSPYRIHISFKDTCLKVYSNIFRIQQGDEFVLETL